MPVVTSDGWVCGGRSRWEYHSPAHSRGYCLHIVHFPASAERPHIHLFHDREVWRVVSTQGDGGVSEGWSGYRAAQLVSSVMSFCNLLLSMEVICVLSLGGGGAKHPPKFTVLTACEACRQRCGRDATGQKQHL